jgi:hypothetical protein
VNSSPTFKWLVIVLVPLTLGWKLIEGGTASPESKIEIIDFLSRQGFEVTERTWDDYSFIDATTTTTGACRMFVFEASPDGSARDIVRQIFGATQRQFFVFRGSIYTKQPTWLTMSDHLWSRTLRRLGFARRDAPVIAVSATGPCGPEQLPWDELSFRTGEAPLPIPG